MRGTGAIQLTTLQKTQDVGQEDDLDVGDGQGSRHGLHQLGYSDVNITFSSLHRLRVFRWNVTSRPSNYVRGGDISHIIGDNTSQAKNTDFLLKVLVGQDVTEFMSLCIIHGVEKSCKNSRLRVDPKT